MGSSAEEAPAHLHNAFGSWSGGPTRDGTPLDLRTPSVIETIGEWVDPLARSLAADVEAVDGRASPLVLVDADRAAQTYALRLARWKDTGLPSCDGLFEFVKALRDAGSARVAGGVLQTPRRSWVVLLDESASRVLAAVRINEPPRERPPQERIDRGEYE